MLAGGLGLALFALSKGKRLPGFLGVGAAGLGGALLGVGLHKKGVADGRKQAEQEILPAFQGLQAQADKTISDMQTQYEATITQLRQGGGGAGGTGPGTGDAGATPGGAGDPTADPTGGTPGGTPGEGMPGQDTAPVIDIPTAATTGTGPGTALVGASVTLPAGAGSTGEIAAGGAFTIAAAVGQAAGYATLEEANAAVQATVSTQTMGSRHLRYVVIQQGQKFYSAVAKAAEGGTPAGPALTPEQGKVVAWNAINHMDAAGWQTYTWTEQGGGRSTSVPYGQPKPFAPNAGPVAGTPAPAPGAPPVAGPATPTPSPASTPAFDPASQLTRTFSLNDSGTARGGVLQLQSVAGSSTGYATGAEATSAARQARAAAGGGSEWTRWITTQGGDGRFYVFQGSLVSRATADLTAAAPLHVLGRGFAEYYDGAARAWVAVADAA
ncbi:MAG: hypothetical protein JWP66_246 [Naasia sp.]|nr:hypothetical protein [Naasia sp.]